MSAPAPVLAAPPTADLVKVSGDEEVKVKPGGMHFNNQGPHQNRGGGGGGFPKRRRGGGSMGPGRNSFGGRGGGGFQGGGFERRSFPGEFDSPLVKKSKMLAPDFRVFEKLRSVQGPTHDLPPTPFELKKFLANTRLYIGNIAPDVTEAEIKDLFASYGEVDEVFINREKNFAFLKLDFRTNAERARSELDQYQLKNRQIKVRFAPATVRVKVKNLNPMVSNELLELAFGIFGDIERALVFVDDKGKSMCEGVVDFTRKNNAAMAHKFCTEKCFFLTSDLRPVITEMGEMCEMDEGLLEMNLPKRDFRRGQEMDYHKARELGPRFAEEGSFESDYGEKWKALIQEYKVKEQALKQEMEKEIEQLSTKIEMARYDYETEMLRQQLRQREQDHERHKMEYENRIPRDFARALGGGGFANGAGGGNAGNGMSRQVALEAQGLEAMESGNADGAPAPGGGFFIGSNAGGSMPLAPPPMPPQGLMAHLQNEPAVAPGPTWELPSTYNRGLGRGKGTARPRPDPAQYSAFRPQDVHYDAPQPQSHSNLGLNHESIDDNYDEEIVRGILLPNPLSNRIKNSYDSLNGLPPETDDDCVIVAEDANSFDPATFERRSQQDRTAQGTGKNYYPDRQNTNNEPVFTYVGKSRTPPQRLVESPKPLINFQMGGSHRTQAQGQEEDRRGPRHHQYREHEECREPQRQQQYRNDEQPEVTFRQLAWGDELDQFEVPTLKQRFSPRPLREDGDEFQRAVRQLGLGPNHSNPDYRNGSNASHRGGLHGTPRQLLNNRDRDRDDSRGVARVARNPDPDPSAERRGRGKTFRGFSKRASFVETSNSGAGYHRRF